MPNGHLLAAWIALEDIHEDAGRFYVFPGSHRVVLHEAGMPESAWLARVDRYVAENERKRLAPALAKGDVLFWNSRTIHGSLATRDTGRSRKSLTAHYLPSQMTFGNLFVSKPWIRYEEVDGHLTFANQPEYSLKARAVSGVKKASYDSPRLMRLVRRFQNRAISDLR